MIRHDAKISTKMKKYNMIYYIKWMEGICVCTGVASSWRRRSSTSDAETSWRFGLFFVFVAWQPVAVVAERKGGGVTRSHRNRVGGLRSRKQNTAFSHFSSFFRARKQISSLVYTFREYLTQPAIPHYARNTVCAVFGTLLSREACYAKLLA